ncbi:unnamed protein product [Allacma fusca]|uniref:Uncharacterized protein n=1 Tax=Allacma fusca TaxID=39272 RepID=A0A8J2KPC1_9HEXA|nr:unnamed protein product [Allacma fusca]
MLDLQFLKTRGPISHRKGCRYQSNGYLYCLSKIPSLRTLSFHWSKGLSLQEVRDCLGHLRKIKIFNAADFQASMVKLRERLPNIVAVGVNVRS